MYQGTYHYVQRFVGSISPELPASDADGVELEPQEFWVDVPFEDGTVWRSRRFVTAANHIDAIRAQEIAAGAELERYRVVKRTFQEEVIVPRWRYVEFLSGVGADSESWERIAFGEHGADWRSRTFTAAKFEIEQRLEHMTGDAKFRIVNQDGEVQGEFTRSDFYGGADSLEDVFADDDAELTETLEAQVGQVPDEGVDPEATQELTSVPEFELVEGPEGPEAEKPEYLHYENMDGTIG